MENSFDDSLNCDTGLYHLHVFFYFFSFGWLLTHFVFVFLSVFTKKRLDKGSRSHRVCFWCDLCVIYCVFWTKRSHTHKKNIEMETKAQNDSTHIVRSRYKLLHRNIWCHVSLVLLLNIKDPYCYSDGTKTIQFVWFIGKRGHNVSFFFRAKQCWIFFWVFY